MNRADELKAEIKALRLELSQKTALLALALCPFEVGDVITKKETAPSHLQDGTYRVTEIFARYDGYGIKGVRIKKDGNEGAVVRLHFPDDFEKVK